MHVDDLSDAILFSLKFWDPSSKDAPLDKKGTLSYTLTLVSEDIQISDLANMISSEMDYKGRYYGIQRKKMVPRENYLIFLVSRN